MVRRESAADRELNAHLAARGLVGSGPRYERWRRAGFLPPNEHRGAGRGRGSVSTLSPETIETAAALARHTTQGRDLHAAVVDWFFEAGLPVAPGETSVPEPPDDKVAFALARTARRDPGYRLIQQARAAVTEADKDEFYDAATERAHRGRNTPAGFDPAAVREALLAHHDIPEDVFCTGARRTDTVHYLAALGFGPEDVGPDALAEAIAASGLFPQISAESLRDALTEAMSSRRAADELAQIISFDPAELLENAGNPRLRRAREVAIGLAGFGSLLLMHALLMPDTPALSALRSRIDKLGVGPLLMNLTRQVTEPHGVALAIAACLWGLLT